jgi:hypothetical protein
MKSKPLLVAVALAVCLSLLSSPAAADHGSTHDIELFGSATYVDGSTLDDTNTVDLVAVGESTNTTLDSTTLTSNGEIANQSTGAGTPLTATVSNGTELKLVLNDDHTATEFPVDELWRVTNASGAYHVEAVFDTGQEISEYHSATLEADTGTELARWDGSDYVTTDDTESTTDTDPEPEPEPEPDYWSYPDKPTEEDTESNETVEEAEKSWFDRIFGSSDSETDDDDQPSWVDFDTIWDRLRGGA